VQGGDVGEGVAVDGEDVGVVAGCELPLLVATLHAAEAW
jgi:hypothetical protein